MNQLFETLRAAVPVPEAALRYGLQPTGGGMVRCPFHDDRTPSMKLYDDHYYCFGCHAHGDVTDLTAGLLSLRPWEAARRLAADFGVEDGGGAPLPAPKGAELLRYRWELARCLRELNACLRTLRGWREDCAPPGPEAPLSAKFVEACRTADAVDGLIDSLLEGSTEQRMRLVSELTEGGRLARLQARLAALEAEDDRKEAG